MGTRTLVLACFFITIGICEIKAQTDSLIVKRQYLSSNFRTYGADQEVPFIATVTSKVILYGERHDESQSQSYFLSLFKSCLGYDHSFRLLLEGGPSEEYLLREYVRIGSRKIILDGLGVRMCSRREEKRYFAPVRESIINNGYYNDSIRYIYAIDFERHFSTSLMTLGYILNKCPTQLESQGANCKDTLLRYFPSRDENTLHRVVRYVIGDFNRDSLKYFTKLPIEEYVYYSRIIQALRAGLTYDSLGGAKNNQAAEFREIFMFNNLSKVLEENTQLRFVGEFGITHVVGYQERWTFYRQWESLATRTEKRFPNQLCRIVNYYNGENYFENKVIIRDSDIGLFRPLFHKHDATIFDLRIGKNMFNTVFDFIQVLN